MSVEMIKAFEDLKYDNPVMYGVVCCALVFMIILLISVVVTCDATRRKFTNAEKSKSAVDLIGKDAIYQIGSSRLVGRIVSVDYDLDDDDSVVDTIYIDVDGVEDYIRARYKDIGKTLFVGGTEKTQ